MPSDGAAAGHASRSVLTIDLGAIAANYRALQGRLVRARCAAVVKADAYGLGAARVAPALAAAGCAEFFVAQLGEGLALRAVLSDAAIFVLNGLLPPEAEAYRRHRLMPVLNDLEQIAAWSQAARAAGGLPAAIHFDTGMSRLGLAPMQAERLIAEPQRLEAIDLRLVMSHLACADEPAHPLNRAQHERFAALCACFPSTAASLANSSGIFLGEDYHFDLVRPGCALYGINPTPDAPNPMRAVARLEARVLQVRAIDHPGTVGYGATHHVTPGARIATLAAGYADGWPRALSSRGNAFIAGHLVPFAGRVSMDLITLDVTSVPGLRTGDAVELMGDRILVDDIAAAAGTIGYEVLTRLGARFERRYVNDPAGA